MRRPSSASLALALAASIAASSAPASANQTSHSFSFPLQQVPWTGQTQLPYFDPSLGVLTQVTIDVGGTIDGQALLENTNAQAVEATFMPSVWVDTTFPHGVIPDLNPAYDSPGTYQLPAFDGVLDFGGTSGFTTFFANQSGQGAPSYTWGGSGPFMAQFVGPAGSPGSFTFGVNVFDGTNLFGVPAGVANGYALSARVHVTVNYRYETFTSFCTPGSAGTGACPCGNPLTWADGGCDNSSGTGGALLSGIGNTNLSADSFRLKTFAQPSTALSIVLQGDAAVAGGVPFGQGVRCVAGVLRRLYALNASGGSLTVGAPVSASISAQSAALGDPLSAGSRRYYMVYYRDPVVLGGCPSGATFNATQALDVVWEN